MQHIPRLFGGYRHTVQIWDENTAGRARVGRSCGAGWKSSGPGRTKRFNSAGFKFILNQENNQKVSIRSMHCNY